jgi:hypothetical protein
MGTSNILGQRRYRLRQRRRMAALALGLGDRSTSSAEPERSPAMIATNPPHGHDPVTTEGVGGDH